MISWVLRSSEERLGNRLVLLALAEFAHDDGGRAFPSVATLAERTRLSERAVQNSLKALQDTNAIIKTGKTPGGTNVYRVLMTETAPADSAPPQSTTSEPSDSAPDPVLDPSGSSGPSSRGAELEGFGGAMGTLPPDFPVKEVNRKKVTQAEAALARAIIAAFNAQFGTDFRGKDHYIDVIGRIRERPELTLDEHIALIERFSHTTWWKKNGTKTLSHPSVKHLYGSGRALDAAFNFRPEDAGDDGLDAYTKKPDA